MRILLLTHSLNPRGGVVHVLELGAALMQRGHAVTVLAPAEPGQRLFRATPCRVEYALVAAAQTTLAATVRARIDAMRAHLLRLLASESFDVFHAHDGIGANALADLRAAGRIPGYARTVHHVDRYGDDEVQAWEERAIRCASQVLCVSATWRARLQAEWGVRAEQVANGVDLQRFRPAATDAETHADRQIVAPLGVGGGGRTVVLSVGGIEARKNTRRLLAAFTQLRRQLPQAQLVIAGGASLLDHSAEAQGFRSDAAASGLRIGPSLDVVVTGPLPDQALPALYRTANVVAMPSLLEGFGLAALEGLACGTPAVVSRIAPFTEHFAQGDVDWSDPLDPQAIAAALSRAIRRPRSRRVPPVCRRFSWAASAERHEQLYSAAALEQPACLP